LGERLPSINETAEEFLVARDTVERAYKKLRELGYIKSVPGKGYYVCNTAVTSSLKICLVFNKLSTYKKSTYDSFIKEIDNRAIVDLHVYNYNIKLFERIIKSHLTDYDYFVIVPHFLPGSIGLEEIIQLIPKDKVIIIDKKINKLFEKYPTVYQDFEEDIIEALSKGSQLLRKYKKLNIIFPKSRFFSPEILIGFKRFCKTYNIDYKVIDEIDKEEIEYNNAYIAISDDDLVTLLKQSEEKGYILGKAIGVISYNENPVKELLASGITTISTNHEKLGRYAAEMIITKKWNRIKIPFELNIRNSL
jgi:DNA-binding transcriptional regulator YhcF (GntR family)